MTCPAPLPTPEARRAEVKRLVDTCPPNQRGLLRVRLYAETPDDLVENVCGRRYKVRCVVCWKPRSRHLVLKEVKEHPVVTCRHPDCEQVWKRVRAKETAVHEAAKAGLLASLLGSGLGSCHV